MKPSHEPPTSSAQDPSVLTRVRRLPIRGETLVAVGDRVTAADVVARTLEPGEVVSLAAAAMLGLAPSEVPAALTIPVGANVTKGQCLGRSSSWFGLFEQTLLCPFDAVLESVSAVTGHCLLRKPSRPLDLPAYLAGIVTEVCDGESVTIQGPGGVLHGVLGVGGERIGPLHVLSKPEALHRDHKGAILVLRERLTADFLERAVSAEAVGVVGSSIHDEDLTAFLGHELGLAVTGNEALPFTLILTEGFGNVHMAEKRWELLSQNDGNMVSLNGTTQIRAGAVRPEILLPQNPTRETAGSLRAGRFLTGARLRCVREPWFGLEGIAVAFPAEPLRLPTESVVPCVRVLFDDGTQADLPLANLEWLTEDGSG